MIQTKLIFLLILLALNVNSQQWIQTNGPIGGNIKDIKLYNGFLFAACDPGGVFRSSDNGISWTVKSTGIFYISNAIRGITFSNGILYAGGLFLWKSSNNGDNWTQIAGISSSIKTMANIGQRVLAGSINGLYISVDNGNTWNESNTGLDNRYLLTLKVNSDKIYAGTLGGGVYVSNDSGSSWQSIINGLTNLFINDIEVYGGNLFAATSNGGVFKSTNNGTNWFYSGSGITFPNVISLTVHNSNLYAGNYGGGIFRSTNSGASWQAVNTGLPADAIPDALESFNNTLFTGMFGDGVYRSADNGSTWQISNTGLIASFIPVMAECSAGILAAGQRRIYLSADNGISWQLKSTGLSCTNISSMTVNNNDIYVGTTGGCGMYLSTNNGNSWSGINNGISGNIVSLSSNGTHVFTATNNGVFITTNGGAQWYNANSGLMSLNIFTLLCTPGNVYLTNSNGLYRSTNNGNQWTYSGSGLPSGFTNRMCYSNGNLFVTTGGGIYYSSNNGVSWVQRNNGLPQTIVDNIVSSGGNVFAFSFVIGINFSSNNGLNWYPYNTGFTSVPQSMYASDSLVFAGSTDRGVFKTPGNLIGIKNISGEVPRDFMLYQNYPNPFNPVTKIRLDLPVNDFTVLKVYDILGKEISILVNRQLQAGKYEIEWDGSNYAGGVYFYSIQAGKYSVTRRMILIK